jgi:hypothetical protein
MAKRGVVTASFSYRVYNSDNENQLEHFSSDSVNCFGTDRFALFFECLDEAEKALFTSELYYKIAQDGRAAVRFIASHPSFKVDPAKVFIGGTSAGAMVAVTTAYLDETDYLDEGNLYNFNYMKNVVGLLGIDKTAHPKVKVDYPGVAGVVSYWGGIPIPNWIDEGEPPILQFHGTWDNTLPYQEGFLQRVPFFPYLYGAEAIACRAKNLNPPVPYSFTSICKGPHRLWKVNQSCQPVEEMAGSGISVADVFIKKTGVFINNVLENQLPAESVTILNINDIVGLNQPNPFPTLSLMIPDSSHCPVNTTEIDLYCND